MQKLEGPVYQNSGGTKVCVCVCIGPGVGGVNTYHLAWKVVSDIDIRLDLYRVHVIRPQPALIRPRPRRPRRCRH